MSDSWEEIGTMPSRRAYSASVYLENFGLMMAGGYDFTTNPDDSNWLDSVILTKDGSTFETLDSLPTPSDYGCLTAIGQTTLLLTGGRGSPELFYQALSYDITTNNWTRYHAER